MGYYASGSGSVTVKPGVDIETIMDKLKFSFEEVYLGAQSNEICFSVYDKYHEDDVQDTLNSIQSYISEGEVCYTGEDECYWRFILQDGVWLEQNGYIVYE